MEYNADQRFSVLMVEEDCDFSLLLRHGFDTQNGRMPRIERATTLKNALSMVQEQAYHILLIESEFDGKKKQGLELIREIQKRNIQIHSILLTPVRDEALIEQANQLGVRDLIIKNECRFEELVSRLSECYKQFCDHPDGQSASDHEQTVIGDRTYRLSSVWDEEVHHIRDDLTGVFNHTTLHDRINREYARALRYSHPISCLVIDIDHFSRINHEQGHKAGDRLLKEFSSMLLGNCRISDLIGRTGGKEFAAVIPYENYDGAIKLAKRLHQIVEEHTFVEGDSDLKLTISIGVSSFPEDPMSSRYQLLEYAQQALNKSKSSGRNRLSLYKDIAPASGYAIPEFKISEEKIFEFQKKLSNIFDSARQTYVEASKALIMALENKDPFTVGHAANCARYCMKVAEMMGLTVEDVETIQHAALLHDIGKVCIPDEILLKAGKLDMAQYEIMKKHSYFGYQILRPLRFLREESVLVLHHHEWFNGEGYPCRLKGNSIALGARIIAVVDTYDTIRSAGARYKKTMTVEGTVNELIACSGTQFDPFVVKAFIDVLKMLREIPDEAVIHIDNLYERMSECLESSQEGQDRPF